MSTIMEVLEEHKGFACGNEYIYDVEEEWNIFGFTGDEVEEWLNARCFCAPSARDLREEGILPEEAKMEVKIRGIQDTIGYLYANADLNIEQVKEMVN